MADVTIPLYDNNFSALPALIRQAYRAPEAQAGLDLGQKLQHRGKTQAEVTADGPASSSQPQAPGCPRLLSTRPDHEERGRTC